MADGMAVVGGQSWTVRELFGRRYLVDPYQREFIWETSHVQDLVNDLVAKFLRSYRPEHEIRHVTTYQPYFLGPVVTHKDQGRTFIVDGQQRMTTLMLLLIWLQRLQTDRDDAVPGLATLIVTDNFGTSSFAVEDILEPREPVLSALFAGRPVDPDEPRSLSARNIIDRYADIEDLFPLDLRDDELPHFIYFLLERITLVEISTYDDKLALETFESMNDRGLRLGNVDLLKSFILQKTDPADRATITRSWRASVAGLLDIDSNGDINFMKSWLRAKLSRNASDDDAIGRNFNRWLRTNHDKVELKYPGQFASLVKTDMDRLAKRYSELVHAAKRPMPGLDAVYLNGLNKVTLQLPLILAAVDPNDNDAAFVTKANMVAGYLDIVVARRLVNYVDFSYESLTHAMFALAREIRGMDPDALARRLGQALADIPETFDGIASYSLRPGHRTRTKYLLSRLTAWLQVQCDPNPNRPTQAQAVQSLRAHEIEHLWANNPAYHPEVPPRRFQAVRNQLGALVLLTKDINASIGDDPYGKKIRHYFGNALAYSLSDLCYQNNPRFLDVMKTDKLPFKPYSDVDEAAIKERQKLYRLLCERVWDPKQYGLIVPASPRTAAPGRPTYRGITVSQLVQRGVVPTGARVIGSHRGMDYHAQVTAEGHFVVDSGETFTSPSAAAAAVLERPSAGGWTFWRVMLPDGTSATLDALRRTAANS